MVTVLQFAAGLSDRQAAEAVQARIDWKYCLGLALNDPGFDCSVLSEFRAGSLSTARHARNRGIAKTYLEHVFSAVAINLIRLDAPGWAEHQTAAAPANSNDSPTPWPAEFADRTGQPPKRGAFQALHERTRYTITVIMMLGRFVRFLPCLLIARLSVITIR